MRERGRLFALVNLAMANGFIGGFESKYYFSNAARSLPFGRVAIAMAELPTNSANIGLPRDHRAILEQALFFCSPVGHGSRIFP